MKFFSTKKLSLISLLIVFTLCSLAGCSSSGSSTATPTPTIVTYKAGMYKIGTDLPAGEYIVIQKDSICSSTIAKDSSGSSSSIIALDIIYNRFFVTVSEGQYWTVSGGIIYNAKDAPKVTATDGKYPEGGYKIGTDIPAGEYVVVQNDNICSLEIAKDSTCFTSSLIGIEIVPGRSYVTVSAGQYLTVSGGNIYAAKDAPKVSATDGKYPEGCYKIGTDIAAGEYKVVKDDSLCSMTVTKDSTKLSSSIVSIKIVDSENYITVKDGQYLLVSGGYIKAK